MNKLKIIYIIIIFICFSSCKNDEVAEAVDIGYNYFPFSTGRWLQYDVDSTVWDDFTSKKTKYEYQIKEVYESFFTDGEGNQAIRLEVYYREKDTLNWQLKRVWSLNKKLKSIEKVQENIRYKKLVFPISENTTWDANASNFLDAEIYSYIDINESKTFNENTYDSTITVQQSDFYNLLEEDLRYEVYSKNIGMIKSFKRIADKHIANQDSIIKGVQVEYNLIDYGN